MNMEKIVTAIPLNETINSRECIKFATNQNLEKLYTTKMHKKKIILNENVNVLSVSNVEAYKCNECDKKFASKQNLITHFTSKMHKGIKDLNNTIIFDYGMDKDHLECFECNKKFSTKQNLKNHINSKLHIKNLSLNADNKQLFKLSVINLLSNFLSIRKS